MIEDWKINQSDIYAECEIESWQEYVDSIETNFIDHKEYLYRGHRDSSWKLEPTFDRFYNLQYNRLKEIDEKYVSHLDYQKTLDAHVENFERNSIGKRVSSAKQLTKNEWMALGQHYGLETPLLDCTSPYVALFFAMEKSYAPTSEKRTVWIFSPLGLQEIAINQDPPVEFVEEIDLPTDENVRLLSQSGKFTLTPKNCSIEDYISKNIRLTGHSPVLYRINIPEDLREGMLRHLNSMNINHATIYPDLTGSALRTNRELEKILTKKHWTDNGDYIARLFSLNHLVHN